MKITKLVLLSLAFGSVFLSAQTQADRDAVKRDICVILDVSGSMKEERKFSNVQDYLERELIDGLLKTGDIFTLVVFGDSAREQFSRSISSEADKTALKVELRRLSAEDDYTDIGAAMEKLSELLERRQSPELRRLIFFITDGKNTPPRNSPYYGKDLAVDERFLSIGEKIAKSGWFLYVVGIGGGTAAGKVAASVEGSVYQETDSALSDIAPASDIEKADQDTLRTAEEARIEEERRVEEERKAEEARRAENASGVSGFLAGLSSFLGIPAAGAVILGILRLLVLLLILLFRLFRRITVRISDGKEILERSIAPFGGLLLNSGDSVLPGIGGGDAKLFRIERNFGGLRIRILDGGAFAETSCYKKPGLYKVQGPLELKNGKTITVS